MRISDGRFSLFLEPGLMMNITYRQVGINLTDEHGVPYTDTWVGTGKGTWCATDAKAGLCLTEGNAVFRLGYLFSTLDVYGMRRNMVYDNRRFDEFYPKRKCVHGGMLAVSCLF